MKTSIKQKNEIIVTTTAVIIIVMNASVFIDLLKQSTF